jgi:hypothetical protein
MTAERDRQTSVRISNDVDPWLASRSGSAKNRAGIVRPLIEKAPDSEREQELLKLFDLAAAEVTPEDIEDRESLLGVFVGGPK